MVDPLVLYSKILANLTKLGESSGGLFTKSDITEAYSKSIIPASNAARSEIFDNYLDLALTATVIEISPDDPNFQDCVYDGIAYSTEYGCDKYVETA